MSLQTVSFTTTAARRGKGKRRLPSRPTAPGPRPGVARFALLVAGTGLGVVTALAVIDETSRQLTAPGGLYTFVGSLTGLVGMYLALIMLVLISRIPAVERVLGQDGLLHWHRRLAPWPIYLLIAHAVFITAGYAEAAKSGLWHEVGVLLNSYPDVLIATVGLGLMILIGAVSLRAVRRRLRHEIWWLIHLSMYLALALSFAHVLALGPSFVGHPLTRVVWSMVWAATAGLVICYRFGLPVVRSLRHRLVVAEVRREGPGVISVILSGQQVERLKVDGGQFFWWRFLTPSMWWQAHPYSLSALPQPPYLRLTVKAVGDHSTALARIKPGTRVFVEGPYGAFTRHAQQRPRVLLIAGGIGITAMRSLLEDLPRDAAPVVVRRVSRPEDLVLRDEISELVRARRGQLHEIVGTRDEAEFTEQTLARLVPDLPRRDIYVCGPEGFVAATVELAERLGVPGESIHHEAFAL